MAKSIVSKFPIPAMICSKDILLGYPVNTIYSFPSIVLFVICISPSHGLYITPKSCPAGIEFVWIQTDLLFYKRDFGKLAFQAIEAI